MMTQRLLSEQLFHDDQAALRANTFSNEPELWLFADDEFLDHESWVRSAWSYFGQLDGKVALDYGCGHGMAAVVLARAGASVSAFDLSAGYVAEATTRAVMNSVQVRCTVADAEQLPYPDSTFDVVWGNAILHHLDLDRAGAELLRVLKPGGTAVFCEPWGGNPVLEFARRHLPYPGKGRTVDEVPLRHGSLKPLKNGFARVEIEHHQLLSMVGRILRWPWLRSKLFRLDRALIRLSPSLGNLCRYAVIVLHKAQA